MARAMKEVLIASFSGGRSSGYMVCKLLAERKRIDHLIFCNTGMETPETYEFIRACNKYLFNGKLTCLEFCLKGKERTYKIVDVDKLNTKGRPFKDLVKATKKLPNVSQRTCTAELKANTKYRYMYDLYDAAKLRVKNYIGYRVDEKNQKRIAVARQHNYGLEKRWNDGKPGLKWNSDYLLLPLVDGKITNDMVIKFWKSNPIAARLSFDIADKQIRISNCIGCFYGNEHEQAMTILKYPDIARRWKAMERYVNNHQHAKGNDARETTKRQNWVLANLGRALTETELREFSFHGQATWKQMYEHTQGKTLKNALFEIAPLAIAGGCGDGECGTDID